jgi:hypothetical protein
MSTVATVVEQIMMEFNGAMSKEAKILAIAAVEFIGSSES